MTIAIQRHSPDRIVGAQRAGKCCIRRTLELRLLKSHQPLALPWNNELGIVNQPHAMLHGETLRPCSNKINMGTVVEYQTRCMNRILQPLHTCDPAGTKVLSIHQQRIQLHPAILRQKRTSPGIEGLIIFHYRNCRLYCIDGASPAFQKGIAGLNGLRNSSLMGFDRIIRHRPRAAVNQESWRVIHLFKLYS